MRLHQLRLTTKLDRHEFNHVMRMVFNSWPAPDDLEVTPRVALAIWTADTLIRLGVLDLPMAANAAAELIKQTHAPHLDQPEKHQIVLRIADREWVAVPDGMRSLSTGEITQSALPFVEKSIYDVSEIYRQRNKDCL